MQRLCCVGDERTNMKYCWNSSGKKVYSTRRKICYSAIQGTGIFGFKWLKEVRLSCRSLNAKVAQSKHCPFEVNTTIGPKSVTITSYSNVIYRRMFHRRSVQVLSDVVVAFLRAIALLTPKEQFLDCATIAFIELCK